jgi:NAD(P)-dependent dehydrogenase (short-subunit alcohol dehydrogenase family)
MSNAPAAPTSALNLFSLKGRRALVTGGHMGLGITMARALADAGADVALASRTLDACRASAAALATATGAKTAAFKVDVASADDVARLAADVDRDFGPIDILINNAGINRRGAIEDLSEEDFDAVMATNVKGVFLVCRAFMPKMRERGWGRVVNLASILGTVGMAQRVPYASSKAAVANMTRVLGLEFADHGRHRQRDRAGPVRHRDEPLAARRPGEVQGVRREDPDGTLGRAARAFRRRGVPVVGCLVVRHGQHPARRRRLDRAVERPATAP